MPSGKTGVTRDEAKSQCQASGFWLPEMFARPDFNTAQTAAAFGNLLELGEVITKILQILFCIFYLLSLFYISVIYFKYNFFFAF
jgi:hypothetical protein